MLEKVFGDQSPAELLRQPDADFPERRTLSRPRQCFWDAAARSDALFMLKGPSTSKADTPLPHVPAIQCNYDAHA